jgi:murein DD-endopeptidase MepM/ murein hydrolase activator NlpD
MAVNHTSFPKLARAAMVLAVFVVVGATVPGAAAAPSKQAVEAAKRKVQQLKIEVAREQQQLSTLQLSVANATNAFLQAQDAYTQVSSQYDDVLQRLRGARQRYAEITARLNDRARQAYISGPGSNLEFILGSTSLTELSDRMEFIDAVTQSDADLAQQVQNTKNVLADSAAQLDKLRAEKKRAYLKQRQKQVQLQANLGAQQRLVDHIDSQLAQAQRYADKLSKQYQAWLKSQAGGVTWGNGIFKACPVGQPRAFGDDFGAPRYSGGFHLHAGNDIIAPMGTPIYAPFDGVASSSYNTLGGNSEVVTGSLGYVYNAHLSAYSVNSNGSVHAGDVIGYVGNTGDAQGGVTHDHFEWHPNQIPSPDSWPKSQYGYSVIDTAVNPHPLLEQACN